MRVYVCMYMYICACMCTFASSLCCTAALPQLGCIDTVVLCCHRFAALPVLCCIAIVMPCCHCFGALPLLWHLATVMQLGSSCGIACYAVWPLLLCTVACMPPCLSQCFLFSACATYLLVALLSIQFMLPRGLFAYLLYVDHK